MRRIKKEGDRKIRISITIDSQINKTIQELTNNKSKFIEYSLLEYFNKCGLDTSKVRL